LKLVSIAVFVCFILLAGCGGGGGGGGNASTSTPSVVFGAFPSGNIDTDGDGTVVINYTLTCAAEKSVNISVLFSDDEGVTYSSCTEDTSPMLGVEANPTQGLTNLTAGPDGVEHSFSWDSDDPGDLPNQNINWLILKITVVNGGAATSGFLILLNEQGDVQSPGFASLTPTAVQGPSNDILSFTFTEPVEQVDAEDLSNYSLQNPVGSSITIPYGSTISYDAMSKEGSIVLKGAANLQHGETCRLSATGIRDLVGNLIENNPQNWIDSAVVGDGDNPSQDLPVLDLVWYTGTGFPIAGNGLCFLFDEEMALKQGASMSNEDVVFWDNLESLGDGSSLAISLIDAYTVQVELGANTSFTPEVSRIAFSALNDKVADLAGNEPIPPSIIDDYILIMYYDTDPPVVDQITLNDIPDLLAGKGSAGGYLLAPRTGFNMNLSYHDVGGSGVDTNKLEIWNSRAVTVNGIPVVANTNLIPYLQLILKDSGAAEFSVSSEMLFPTGMNQLCGRVADLMGTLSTGVVISFQVTNPTEGLRPFEPNNNPSQVWKLIFKRDIYSINMTVVGSGNSVVMDVQAGSNGSPDFEEDLMLFGFRSTVPIAIPGHLDDSNEFMRKYIVSKIISELDFIFTGVNIEFHEAMEAAFPGEIYQTPYSSWGHSQICIGGQSDIGALGVAFIDRANSNQDNDALYNGSQPYNPGVHLGVFTTGLYQYEVNNYSSAPFRIAFDPFIPGRGTPVGEGSDDQDILMELAGSGPAVSGGAAVRRDTIIDSVRKMARMVAVTTAHETGHSMGLSVNNAMPSGLYGGDPVNFPGSNSNHLDLTSFSFGLYASPAGNIMRPYTNFQQSINSGTRFNWLNKAYLQEKIFYYP